MKGQGYILLEIRPPRSQAVALELSRNEAVEYAAAVWGPWDVIMRVKTPDTDALVALLTEIQGRDDVRRTETCFIRNDQLQLENPESFTESGRWAFLLLRVEAQKTLGILQALKTPSHESAKGAEIQHAAGILGPYDIAVTVKHKTDSDLKQFVMDYVQDHVGGVRQTLTIPSIQWMVYRHGKLIG